MSKPREHRKLCDRGSKAQPTLRWFERRRVLVATAAAVAFTAATAAAFAAVLVTVIMAVTAAAAVVIVVMVVTVRTVNVAVSQFFFPQIRLLQRECSSRPAAVGI